MIMEDSRKRNNLERKTLLREVPFTKNIHTNFFASNVSQLLTRVISKEEKGDFRGLARCLPCFDAWVSDNRRLRTTWGSTVGISIQVLQTNT